MADQPPSVPTAAPAASAAPVGPRARRRAARRVATWLAGGIGALVLLALLLSGAALLALWRTEPALPWLLVHVPGLSVQGVRGTLAGGRIEIDRLDWTLPSDAGQLRVEHLVLDGLTLRLRPHPGALAAIALRSANARRVEFHSGPPPATPVAAPTDLGVPLALRVEQLRVQTLQIDTLAPLHGLAARLELGAERGAAHLVDALDVEWEHLHLSGSARLASAAPLALAAQLQAEPVSGPAAPSSAAPVPSGATTVPGAGQSTRSGAVRWQARLQASGNLARFEAGATLRGEAVAGHAAPALDAQATIEPFASWPLAALALTTQSLDLAALSPRLPTTALGGRARVRSSGLAASAEASIELDNTRPGRLDEARLPLRRLRLELAGVPARPRELELRRFEWVLGDAQANAGRASGTGTWRGDRLDLALQLDDLQPARIDARAAALRVSGPLLLHVSGLPLPGAAATAATGAASAGAASAAAAAASAAAAVGAAAGPIRSAPGIGTAGRGGPHLVLQATLAGRALDGSGLPVRLQLAAEGDANTLVVRRAEAAAGSARASASGQARREAAGWRVEAAGRLERFDPLPWWRGGAGSPWRQGPHRLDGRFSTRLLWHAQRAPRSAQAGDLDHWLQAFTGDASAEITDSLLAGVPLTGQLRLHSSGSTVQVNARLEAAGNRIALEGQRGGRSGAGTAADHWHLQAHAPALAALAPLERLAAAALPDAADWLPVAGQVDADVQLDGRWPALRSSGRVQVRGLRSRGATLAQADADWRTGDADGTGAAGGTGGAGATGGDAPLSLQLSARGLTRGTQQIDRVEVQASGSLRSHQWHFVADSPAKPPAWTENLLGAAGSGTRVEADARGTWSAQAGGWQWRVQDLQLHGGVRGAPAGTRPWLELRDVSAELALGNDGALRSIRLAPGRLQLLTTALRWSSADWIAAGPGAGLDLAAELETIDVAALLARAQPGFGWSGNLGVGGRIEIHSRVGRLDADIVLERGGGDLAVTDELGNTQALGLTDLRLALTAHDGLWQFAQGLAGRNIGEMAGAQVLRTTAASRWPAPDAPLEGVLEAHVANLGVWGTWVPPGWRLSGSLRTNASFGGTRGAPELRGELRGAGLGLRNVLLGVNLAEGELAVSLDGDHAVIERMSLKGGDGRLSLSGSATLGAAPSAQLHLDAEHFRLLGRVDRRIVASGQAELGLAAAALRLDGKFRVDEGLVDLGRADAPTLDDDVRVLRSNGRAAPTAAERSAAAPLPAPLRNAQVALAIDLGDKLQLHGRGLATRLRGELHVTSPGGRLAFNGTVRTEGGSYVAYGQKLEIERGEISFTGSADNPRLDILAIRPNLDVRVGVAVIGSALNPRVRLMSEPELPEFDKLSWLVLGRGPDSLGRTDTALLQRAAIALLAGNGKAPTDQLLGALGLTDFSVRQSEGEVRETIVSLGKQLSQRWYVGYERGVNSTTGTWQLIYRIAQRFTLRAQSGVENALDVIWSWRW